MTASGIKLLKDDKPVESEGEARGMIRDRARWFFDTLLPFLRQLGVVE